MSPGKVTVEVGGALVLVLMLVPGSVWVSRVAGLKRRDDGLRLVGGLMIEAQRQVQTSRLYASY